MKGANNLVPCLVSRVGYMYRDILAWFLLQLPSRLFVFGLDIATERSVCGLMLFRVYSLGWDDRGSGGWMDGWRMSNGSRLMPCVCVCGHGYMRFLVFITAC